jgi:hypothetical protein
VVEPLIPTSFVNQREYNDDLTFGEWVGIVIYTVVFIAVGMAIEHRFDIF